MYLSIYILTGLQPGTQSILVERQVSALHPNKALCVACFDLLASQLNEARAFRKDYTQLEASARSCRLCAMVLRAFIDSTRTAVDGTMCRKFQIGNEAGAQVWGARRLNELGVSMLEFRMICIDDDTTRNKLEPLIKNLDNSIQWIEGQGYTTDENLISLPRSVGVDKLEINFKKVKPVGNPVGVWGIGLVSDGYFCKKGQMPCLLEQVHGREPIPLAEWFYNHSSPDDENGKSNLISLHR